MKANCPRRNHQAECVAHGPATVTHPAQSSPVKPSMKPSVSRIRPALWLGLLASLVLVFETNSRVFVATNSTWRYFKGTSEASDPTNAWRKVDFDDSAWLVGTAPFHYGTNTLGGDDNLTGGTILSDMRSNYTCIYLRQQFVIADTNNVGEPRAQSLVRRRAGAMDQWPGPGQRAQCDAAWPTPTPPVLHEKHPPRWLVPVALSLLTPGDQRAVFAGLQPPSDQRRFPDRTSNWRRRPAQFSLRPPTPASWRMQVICGCPCCAPALWTLG